MDSDNGNQRAAAYIKEILELRGIPRNQVAAISGLSNTYIQHLENGQIKNVDRRKVIALAVALNMNLREIDNMLTLFDRAKLSENDIPLFIESGGDRKITSALLPLQAWFTYELIILIGESTPGRIVIVNDQPTANLLPQGYRTYFNRNIVDPHPIYFKLIEAVGRARQSNFINLLDQYPVEHYICRKCLETYIHKDADIKDKQWKQKHVENLIHFIHNYDNFSISLTDSCSRFNFTIKTPDPDIGGNEKLFFQGKAPHAHLVESEQNLTGFATGNQVVIQNFMGGLESIKKKVIAELEDPKHMVGYLEGLIGK
ncbi:MAG: helix-turn-helix transcriptional regulator [Thermodesulfobacteriota bacterium]